jgi:hypothetical protein
MKLFLSIVLLVLSVTMVRANEAIPYINDIPIMPQFKYVSDSLLIFDKPQGQIVEATILCEDSCPSNTNIQNFYSDSLSNLGWSNSSQSSNRYYSNNRQLSFTIQNDNGASIITFTMTE